ncbi:MAG TPA: MBL fold metallo-hydrolase [Tenacibaculum sp.]|nr:MBL fold metallo-hydrolase [Tenacibaculum sp.]HBI39696.1 MBL fold metallo-hydrolase [Tenacibaculum sp.]
MKSIKNLTVSVLIDNTTDMFSSRPDHVDSELKVLMDSGLEIGSGPLLCSAHHGLSLFLEAETENGTKSVLFDAGPDSSGLARNSNHMGVSLENTDAIVLSHGHFDHAEALPKALELIKADKKDNPVPLYVHPGAFVKRAAKLPDGNMLPYTDVPSVDFLTKKGADVKTSSKEETIVDDYFYVSGEIPRNSFENGLSNHYKKDDEGNWTPDPDIEDERFLAVNIKDKGIAIFTGCSHAGIVNVCKHAAEVFKDQPLYALVGGLHLVYPNENLIDETIEELKQFNFKVIIPGHCTGWRAINRFINEFGEKIVDPLAVGTKQHL